MFSMLPNAHHSDVAFFLIFPLKQGYFSNNMPTKVKLNGCCTAPVNKSQIYNLYNSVFD